MKDGMQPIQLLQLGASGQLARELSRAVAADGNIRSTVLSRADVEFTRPQDVYEVVLTAPNVDIVVNTIAYTAVDKAESEKELAYCVNAEAVGRLAQACRHRNVPLIHVSTDYVYDGTKSTPYLESDATNPLSIYGKTKLAGEALIRDTLPAHVIIRTSWVYSAHGSNFVKTMLRLGAEREELRIVDDQRGAPTSAGDLAQAILKIVHDLALSREETRFGTFHFADAGETSWRRFAEEIFRQASWAGVAARVVPIGTAEYPTPARRPANSRLDTTKIGGVFGVVPPSWQASLALVLADLRGSGG
jgi:dTDP-4-dehydrorhamnose reductase